MKAKILRTVKIVRRIILCVLLAGIAVWMVSKFTEESIMEVNKRYAQAALEHLENKYDEEFYVEERWHDTRDAGPIPHFGFPHRCYFIAYPLSDKDYSTKVYIERSEYSYKILEIDDNYYWKFLRPQLLDYLVGNISKYFENYKVDVITYSRSFSNELIHTSSLADLCKLGQNIDVVIDIYVPSPEIGNLGNVLTELIRDIVSNSEIFMATSHIRVITFQDKTRYVRLESNDRKVVLGAEDVMRYSQDSDADILDSKAFYNVE